MGEECIYSKALCSCEDYMKFAEKKLVQLEFVFQRKVSRIQENNSKKQKQNNPNNTCCLPQADANITKMYVCVSREHGIQKQRHSHEFKVNLIYKVRSRTSRALIQKTLWGEKQNKTHTLQNIWFH